MFYLLQSNRDSLKIILMFPNETKKDPKLSSKRLKHGLPKKLEFIFYLKADDEMKATLFKFII